MRCSRRDREILQYIAYHEWATTQQVVRRFWLRRGREPSHGYVVVRRLRERGFLRTRRVKPLAGNASQEALSLRPAGYLEIGRPVPEGRAHDSQELVLWRLQSAEMMLEREAEGFHFIPRDQADAVVSAVRAYALSQYRGRAPDSHLAHRIAVIKRMSPRNLDVPAHLLVHAETSEVRIILPVRRGISYTRRLESLPNLGFLPEIRIELLGHDQVLLDAASASVDRWARAQSAPVQQFRAPDFRTGEHPARTWKRLRERASSTTD